MNTKTKKLLSLITSVLFAFQAMPISAVDITALNEGQANVSEEHLTVDSGTCGENLTWTLDSDGTLTISGTGTMYDYYYDAPWYNYRDGIISCVIEDGVTEIGDGAFSDCSSLTGITIPEGVTEIGDSAFSVCSSLTSITIPEGVTEISFATFYGCSSLTSITIPEGVTAIGDRAFSYCSSLTSITIPEGVTEIGVSAFSYCGSLTSITIPEGVTEIGNDAFSGCSSLTSITIPEGVTAIGNDAFYGCSNLQTVYYGGDVHQWKQIEIGDYGNESLLEATVVFRMNTDPATEPDTEPVTDIETDPIIADNGDINGDGKVNAKDLTRLMKYIAGENVETIGIADINGDGKVNAKDLTRLMKMIAGVTFKEG